MRLAIDNQHWIIKVEKQIFDFNMLIDTKDTSEHSLFNTLLKLLFNTIHCKDRKAIKIKMNRPAFIQFNFYFNKFIDFAGTHEIHDYFDKFLHEELIGHFLGSTLVIDTTFTKCRSSDEDREELYEMELIGGI